jgi:hypothetical protein
MATVMKTEALIAICHLVDMLAEYTDMESGRIDLWGEDAEGYLLKLKAVSAALREEGQA